MSPLLLSLVLLQKGDIVNKARGNLVGLRKRNAYGAPSSGLSARTWKRLILAKIDSRVLGTVTEVTTVPGSVPEKTTFWHEERCSVIAGSRFIYFGDRRRVKQLSKVIEETTKLFKPYPFYVGTIRM